MSRACEARRRAVPFSPSRERGRIKGDAPAFRRSAADLAPATERRNSAQAALHAIGRARALPAPPAALKRGTSRAGHSAGGDDARTAREQLARPPAGTAPAPHPGSHPECAPRWTGLGDVTVLVTDVKPPSRYELHSLREESETYDGAHPYLATETEQAAQLSIYTLEILEEPLSIGKSKSSS
jgi:hypothetical protein